jgi:hypothetical protein
MSVVVENLYCERDSGQQETSGRKPKGLRQYNNHDIHKTQSLLQIIILNLNKIKNIAGDKILAPTKTYPSTKIYTSTKYLRRQKHMCRQNIGFNKIIGITKYWCRQNSGADKNLASTITWCRQKKGWRKQKMAQTQENLLTISSAESAAAVFSQAPLKISYFSLMVLFSFHEVIK